MPVAYVSLWSVSESFHTSLYSKLDGTLEALRLTISSIVGFCETMWPYLLPPLLAIAIEAPLSQRTWIAVQNTPPPRHGDGSPPLTYFRKLRKHALTHLMPVYLLFVSLLASYLQCVAQVTSDKMRTFEGLLFGPVFAFATSRLFGLIMRLYTLTVRRDAAGDPYIIRTPRAFVPSVCRILPVLFGLFVSYRAIRRDDIVCKAIVHTALLHVFIATDARSTKSMKAVGVYALTNIATLVALAIFLAIHANEIKPLFNPSSQPDYPAWEDYHSHESHEYPNIEDAQGYRWPLFALSVLWNIFPVELVTLCYRFDFARFAKREGIDFGDLGGVRTTDDGGPSITHDMLTDSIASTTTSTGKERMNTTGVGPIYLSPDVPDAFYGRPLTVPPPSSPSLPPPLHTSPTTTFSHLKNPTSTSRPAKEQGTPLPPSLRFSKRVSFPAFRASLIAYIAASILASAFFYFILFKCDIPFPAPDPDGNNDGSGNWTADRVDVIMKYVSPLLPLITLPVATIVVPFAVAWRSRPCVHTHPSSDVSNSDSEEDDEDEDTKGHANADWDWETESAEAIMELWRYEEVWESEPVQPIWTDTHIPHDSGAGNENGLKGGERIRDLRDKSDRRTFGSDGWFLSMA